MSFDKMNEYIGLLRLLSNHMPMKKYVSDLNRLIVDIALHFYPPQQEGDSGAKLRTSSLISALSLLFTSIKVKFIISRNRRGFLQRNSINYSRKFITVRNTTNKNKVHSMVQHVLKCL